MEASTKILKEGWEVKQCVIKSRALQGAPETVLHEAVMVRGHKKKVPQMSGLNDRNIPRCKSRHNGESRMSRIRRVC